MLRKLHDEDLNNLYVSPRIVKMQNSDETRWAGHEACMWNGSNFKLVARKHAWEDNIKMGLREKGCDGEHWYHLAEGYGPALSSWALLRGVSQLALLMK
jgi:hypothetical protein